MFLVLPLKCIDFFPLLFLLKSHLSKALVPRESQQHFLCNSVPRSIWFVIVSSVPLLFRSRPGKDQSPRGNLRAYCVLSLNCFSHISSYPFASHAMSLNIDMKLILSLNCSAYDLRAPRPHRRHRFETHPGTITFSPEASSSSSHFQLAHPLPATPFQCPRSRTASLELGSRSTFSSIVQLPLSKLSETTRHMSSCAGTNREDAEKDNTHGFLHNCQPPACQGIPVATTDRSEMTQCQAKKTETTSRLTREQDTSTKVTKKKRKSSVKP